jgi:beta-1,4-mannosyltransferase
MRVAAFPSHLDSNPYCDLLYSHMRKIGIEVVEGEAFSWKWLLENRSKVDVLHFHWLERYCHHWRGGIYSYYSLLRFVMLILAAKIVGYKLIWTMHNYLSHESLNPRVDRAAAAFMARAARTAVHCNYARDLLVSIAAGARCSVIPHGSYVGAYPVELSRAQARESLGIPGSTKVLMFFGMIRMYKGIRSLCESYKKVAGPDTLLLIVGKPYEEREESMLRNMEDEFASSSLKFVPGFVPNEEVAKYFLACDFCVFPYRDVLTSGSVVLSLGFKRPVVVPRAGCLAELEAENVGIFYDPAGSDALMEALKAALAADNWEELSRNAGTYSENLSWERIAKDYLALYLAQ